MEATRRRAAVALFATAGVVYLLDRLTKVWAERALVDGPIDLIPGALTLRFTTNSGGAFSIGQSAPWFFATVTIVVSTIIVVTAFRHTSVLTGVGLGLILGGALGNLTDRAIRGSGLRGRVIDFVDPHIWPIFNVADAAIVIGALLLVLGAFRADREAEGSGIEGRDGAR